MSSKFRFGQEFVEKAKDYVEFRRQVFALLLHNNVINYELDDWNKHQSR